MEKACGACHGTYAREIAELAEIAKLIGVFLCVLRDLLVIVM